MKIHLAYGKQGLDLDLPVGWDVTVLEPEFLPALPNQYAAVQQALQNPIAASPLAEFVRAADRVGIIFNDITRATPSELILSAILEQIPFVPEGQITLFNALGTHRANTDAELRQMLGNTLVDRFRIVQNNAFDPATQVELGQTASGNAIWLNRALVECDVQILTGFIEPHLFAGFSGGGKAVMPGMAGLDTVMRNHTPQAVGHPRSTWGVIEGNPIYQEIQEIAGRLPRTFLVNVALNKHQQVTGVFAGGLREAHRQGCDFVRGTAMRAVPAPFDIVVTTNSGYPLDQNLYQAVKGMSAAAQIVRPGGVIVAASECSDGIPDHGKYADLLRASGSPEGWLAMASQPGFQVHDQWEVQVQAMIRQKAEVYVYSDYLSDDQIEMAWFKPCRDIAATLGSLHDGMASPRIAVLPEGPQTVPYVQRQGGG